MMWWLRLECTEGAAPIGLASSSLAAPILRLLFSSPYTSPHFISTADATSRFFHRPRFPEESLCNILPLCSSRYADNVVSGQGETTPIECRIHRSSRRQGAFPISDSNTTMLSLAGSKTSGLSCSSLCVCDCLSLRVMILHARGWESNMSHSA